MDKKLDVDVFRTLAPELDAETADHEERIIDTILREGECVARFQWDTGNPGAGAGSEDVYRFRGRSFAFPGERVAGP